MPSTLHRSLSSISYNNENQKKHETSCCNLATHNLMELHDCHPRKECIYMGLVTPYHDFRRSRTITFDSNKVKIVVQDKVVTFPGVIEILWKHGSLGSKSHKKRSCMSLSCTHLKGTIVDGTYYTDEQ